MSALDLSPRAARAGLQGQLSPDASDAEAVERWATVVWSCLTEPGDSVARRMIDERGAAGALHALRERAHVASVGPEELTKGRERWLPRMQPAAFEDAVHRADVAGVRLLTREDAAWPVRADDLGVHAPVCLWVRGDVTLPARAGAAVALVGARAATAYGEQVAMELAGDLAATGVCIVSGAAYGIDGAAHRAALSVGGTTIALLAGGADKSYPSGHSALIDRIAAQGAVVSETPCGSAPTKWRFLQRNRLISALSDATVVVEAGWRSGSINTASHAASLGRPLGAVPGPITSATSAGCHRVLREHGAECITSADDVRQLLGWSPDEGAGSGQGADAGGVRATSAEVRVVDAMSSRSARRIDEIAQRAGMAGTEVTAALGLLHMSGRAARSEAGWRLVR